jgi:hypothetical protein
MFLSYLQSVHAQRLLLRKHRAESSWHSSDGKSSLSTLNLGINTTVHQAACLMTWETEGAYIPHKGAQA